MARSHARARETRARAFVRAIKSGHAGVSVYTSCLAVPLNKVLYGAKAQFINY